MTWFLVGVNAAVFLWIRTHGILGSGPHALSNYGANWGFQTLSGQWWRLLTSLFVQTEYGHLLLNIAGIVVFGRRVEKAIGIPGFAVLYFSSGLAGGISLIAFRPDAIGYGASLSVLGLLGGLIGFYSSRLALLANKARFKLAILLVIAGISIWDDISSVRSGNPGHIAGLLTGVALGTAFAMSASVRRHVSAFFALVALVLVAFAVGARRHNPIVPSLYAAARAFDSGNNALAAKEITVVLHIAPDDLSANRIASEIFLREPDYPRAENAIRKVLAANRNDDYFLYLLAVIELRTDRCAEAYLIRERLAELNSKYASTLSQSPCYVFQKGAQSGTISRN